MSFGYVGGAYGRCRRFTESSRHQGVDDVRWSCEELIREEMFRAGPVVAAIEPTGAFSVWHSGVLGSGELGPVRPGKWGIMGPHIDAYIGNVAEAVPPSLEMCPATDKLCYYFEKVDQFYIFPGRYF